MEKILGIFPAIKLPDELHQIIVTDEKLISIFVKKIKRKILPALAAALLGMPYAFEIGSILVSRKRIEDIKDIHIEERGAHAIYWKQIKKISISRLENMVKIKEGNKTYKYIFDDDDFEAFIELLKIKN